MAILLGSSPLWVFLDATGAPANNGTAYFYRNVARSTRKLVYPDQTAVSGTGKSELNINPQGRLEWNDIWFNNDETYFIQVFDEDENLIATIENYGPAGSGGGTVTNFVLEENGFSNGSFDYYKTGSYDESDFTSATPALIAPPSWYYRRTSTADPAEALNFASDDGSGLAVTQIGATQTQATASHYLRYACTATGTVTEKLIYFKLPSVKTYSNKQITISADIRRAAAGVDFNVNFFYIQDYGSGTTGSGEQALVSFGGAKTVTTTWQRFSADVTPANVLTSGLTIDPSRNDALYLGISLSGLLAAVGEIHITNLAVYIGDATGMDYRTQFIANASNLPRPEPIADPSSSNRSPDEGKYPIVNQYGYYDLIDSGDAMRNIIWGGDFSNNPWQDGNRSVTSPAVTVSDPGPIGSVYAADGFEVLYAYVDGTPVYYFDVEKLADAPTASDTGFDYLSKHCHSIKFTTADYTEIADSLIAVRHIVEARDMVQLGGNKASFAFWMKVQMNTAADVTVAVLVSSRNYDQATQRVYYKKFTNTAAQNNKGGTPVWVKHQLEIDTFDFGTGDWRPNNAANLSEDGLIITWVISAGATYTNGSLTEDSWQTIPAANVFVDAALGNDFEFGAGGDTVQIALPQLHQGTILPDFPAQSAEHMTEKAHRYYQKSYNNGTAPQTETQVGFFQGVCQAAAGQSGSAVTSYSVICAHKYDTSLRATPGEFTLYSLSANAWGAQQMINRVNVTDVLSTATYGFPGAPMAENDPADTLFVVQGTSIYDEKGFSKIDVAADKIATSNIAPLQRNQVKAINLFHWVANARFFA